MGADLRGVTILRGHTDVVCALAWSPDGRRLASGTPNMEDAFRLWDPASGKQVGVTSSGWGCGLAWRPDGKQIALAGGLFAEDVSIYDRTGGKEVDGLGGGAGGSFSAVFSVCWSPDGKRLATGCGNGGVRIWDMTARRVLWDQRYGTGAVVVAWGRDGRTLAVADSVGSVLLIRAVDGLIVRRLQSGRGEEAYGVFSPVAWSPDGKWVAAPGVQDSTVA